MPLDVTLVPPIAWLAGTGIAAGLWLLARGLGGYRTATRILAWSFGWMPRPFFAAEVDETTRPAIDLASDR